jgi:uncharacterized protein YjbI with pentapeptide repeats
LGSGNDLSVRRVKMTILVLKEVLFQHSLWLSSNYEKGKRANLEGTDLSGANLCQANLFNANLSGADLSGADLRKAILYRANLRDANLNRADLRKAILVESNLYRANLEGANLVGADLEMANLREAILPEKELIIGNLYEVTYECYPYYFNKAIVCLLSINKDNSFDLIESISGEIHRSVESWVKYSMKEID